MWICLDAGIDAQDGLRPVRNAGVVVAEYYYDGKNRQIARGLNPDQFGAGGVIRFSVWDGWELLEEYGSVRAAGGVWDMKASL